MSYTDVIEGVLLGLFSGAAGIFFGKLLIKLPLKRRIRIAREIEAQVIAETGSNDPNTVRAALDERDPSCKLMHIYFNHVRTTDEDKEVQSA